MGCVPLGSGTNSKQGHAMGNPSNPIDELDDYQRRIERRIVLIGKTGAGKSTLGNAILGNVKFNTKGLPMESTTLSCEVGIAKTGGKKIVVLDTPGAMATSLEQEKILEELLKCTVILAPGPHVFFLVIRADATVMEEETKAVKIFCDFFGELMYKHLVVVFTHKSALDKSNKMAEDCLLKLPKEFLEKYRQYKGCCIAIETEGKMKHVKKEVAKLLKIVEDVIACNDGNFYSNEKMKEAETAYRVRISKIQEKVEQEFEQEKGKRPPEEIHSTIHRTVQERINEDRDIMREEATHSNGFTAMAREWVTQAASVVAGLAFDYALGSVTNVIGTFAGWLKWK